MPAELEQVLAAAGLADGKAAADAVIKYRNSKKFFRLPELKKIPEITDAVFFKIEPCLQVLKKDLPEIIYRINNPDYSELSAAGFLEPSMAELLLLLEKRGYLTGTGDLDNLDIPDEQKQILLGWINF
ncbi:MAG TPA: hypothetical protein DC049_07305 [Spirochaetia bacterium]|nr:hypothetical protein [Spirochaetia bacterium]